MTTLTIEIPDSLAKRLSTLPDAASDLNAFATAALSEAADAAETEPDPDLMASLRAGFAEVDAGTLLTQDDVDAAVAAVLNDRRRKAPDHGA